MELLNKLTGYFANDGLVALLTFVLSVLAIVLSVLSFFSSRSANRKIIDIEKARDEKAEENEKKAILSVSPLKEPKSTGKGHNSYLAVKNSGVSEANEINIYFDGTSEHNYLRDFSHISVLGPDTTKKVSLVITMGTPRPKEVSLTWTNSDGTKGSYKTAY